MSKVNRIVLNTAAVNRVVVLGTKAGKKDVLIYSGDDRREARQAQQKACDLDD